MAKDSSAKYYRDEKEKKSLKKILSKEKKKQYGCDQHKSLPKDEKGRLVEYRKNYSKMEKTLHYN